MISSAFQGSDFVTNSAHVMIEVLRTKTERISSVIKVFRIANLLMIKPTHATPHQRQTRMFGIVAILASATIAILLATDAVNPYPSLKLAYITCAVIGSAGVIQLAYASSMAKQS
jgi:UDP-N-acetylmuramyl pentapeptide phosphotransferase/UDP-N-acetylglucosamine-1-phosphate transferase